MRRLLACFVLFAVAGALSSSTAFGWGSIKGYVYDEATMKPLAGYFVHAYDEPGGTVIGHAKTDVYGKYTIYELHAGVYYVWVYGGERCLSEWWKDTGDPAEADPVEVVDGKPTEGIDFGLACEPLPGCITGRVVDDETGEPIKGAVIKVYKNPEEPPVADAVTGEHGYYEVCKLPPDKYYVFAHALHCEGEWYLERSLPSEADPVEVKSGEVTEGISFTLSCYSIYGCITGRVTDQSTGRPIAGAVIKVYEDPKGEPIADARTGELGYYEVCELEEGTYYVFAHALNCEGEWYNNKYDPSQADPVVVKPDQATKGIDFALDCGPGLGCIVGRVVDEDTGEPIAGAYVAVYTNRFGDPVASAYTGPEGHYEVCKLEQGTYYAMAHASECEKEWFNEKTLPEDADPIEVYAGKVTYGINFGLDCAHTGSGCIVGQVVDEKTGEPIPKAVVRIYVSPGERPIAEVLTGEHGYYEACKLEPGVYYASAHAATCETEWYKERTSPSEADPIEVRAGEVTDGISFTLSCGYPGTGCVTGRVTDEKGNPIKNAFVALLKSPNGDPVYTAYTGELGYYEICKVVAGVYYAFAHFKECDREWYNNKSKPEDADAFEVRAGQVTDGISFSLECAGQNLCICGRVVDEETKEGIEGALVIVMLLDKSYAKYGFTTVYGRYEICDLPAGRYVVFAQADDYIGEFYDNVYRWEDATPVEPPADGICFQLGKRSHLERTVMGMVFSGMGPAPNAMVYAYVSGNAAVEGEPVSSALTGGDGSYKLEGLEDGTYIVTASRPGDPTTSYGEPVKVEGGPVEGIDIHLGATFVRNGTFAYGVTEPFLCGAPNPFRDRARFSFTVPGVSSVRLEVFDLCGRSVGVLVDAVLPEGTYEAEWSAEDIPSGVYVSKLSCGDVTVARKIVLAR